MIGRATILALGGTAWLAACGGTTPPPEASTTSPSSAESMSSTAMSMSENTSCAPSGTTVKVTADNTMFNVSCLAAPAGEPFTIDFNNQDPLPHNVAIYSADPLTNPNATTLFKGTIVTGPKMVVYSVPALSAGTYHFHCDVHPTQMFGTFVVK